MNSNSTAPKITPISRIESFRCAFAGIWHTFKTQRNAQIHAVIAVAIGALALALRVSLTEWAILALTTGFVIAAEMLNTATEAAMDFATTEFHPQIKIVKDVAAGAVLISAITAVVVGALILGPPLLNIIFGGFAG
ncbi:MAG: diacylglycerol kinase family protein [Chloroflexi bacterium]|nr:MAG: diacylglycerol kinase family protein [Chloroflexota bacterium]